jgi:C4-type Zn-finger protein
MIWIVKNIKTIVLIALLVAAVWIYKDWQFQKEENVRQTENSRQLRMQDSLRFANQVLTEREISEYLKYSNSELKQLLDQANIRENRLQSILSIQYKYQDQTSKQYNVSQILEAIKEKKEFTVPFVDTTKCMTIKGNVQYKNDNLSVNITEREFKNKTDNVVYWQRREWRFLGIKTTFLGKKEFTAKTFDQCGESSITKVEIKKK